MGFYSNFILPYCLEWSMSIPLFTEYRRQILADVTGKVLEIGFGTGLNLPLYPSTVETLTIIDANPGMDKLAQQRVKDSPLKIESYILNVESLPMADSTFDSVVSTWTLCSIAQVDLAIAEIHRVLKPGGKFFFIEHGLSRETNIQTWQNRLTPLQKVIADGCHLNRNIKQLIENHFPSVEVEEFYLEDFPKIAGFTYQGVAIKS